MAARNNSQRSRNVLWARVATVFLLTLAATGSLTSCTLPSLEHEQPALIAQRTASSNGTVVAPEGSPKSGWIDYAKLPDHDLAQLWVRDSFYVEQWALHPFFLIYDAQTETWQQWEVWAGELFGFYEKPQQRLKRYSDGRGPQQTTFTHRQLGAVRCWSPMTYIDEGPSECLVGQWHGDDARRLIDVLQEPESYPYHDRYWIWPGPNSNGYARWALDQAALAIDLEPRMIGKDWHGLLGFGAGLTPTRTGLHLDLLTLGAAIGLQDGIELHLLGFTFGIDWWPPALKTPVGRIGLPE